MSNGLLEAIEDSDVRRASEELESQLQGGRNAWEVHLSLFPVVQRVVNPPFINPHLPKMYRILRELAPYLMPAEIPAVVRLEVTEYARRPKLEKLSRSGRPVLQASFGDIEAAIRDQDPDETALLMAAFLDRKGGLELARPLLLLGSVTS